LKPVSGVRYVAQNGALTVEGLRLFGSLADAASSGGSGLPAGGTTGQVLAKDSDADGDASWQDIVFDGGGP